LLGELDTRWLIFTGTGLVGTFEVVEVDIALVDFHGADEIYRAFDQLAFIFEVAVVTLDKGILVGPLWRTNARFDPETLQES